MCQLYAYIECRLNTNKNWLVRFFKVNKNICVPVLWIQYAQAAKAEQRRLAGHSPRDWDTSPRDSKTAVFKIPSGSNCAKVKLEQESRGINSGAYSDWRQFWVLYTHISIFNIHSHRNQIIEPSSVSSQAFKKWTLLPTLNWL